MSFTFLIFLRDIGPAEHKEPGSDYFTRYTPMTQEMIKGKGIPLGKDIGAPGYSLLLVPVFLLSRLSGVSEISITIFFNAILAALTTLVLFLVVKDVFNKNIAFSASLLWASYPLNLWFIKNPHTEIPFFLFFLLAILLYLYGIKQKRSLVMIIGGLVFGFATLIRPVTFYLPVILFFMVFFLTASQTSRKVLTQSQVLTLNEVKRKVLTKGQVLMPARQKQTKGKALNLALLFLLGSMLAVMPWIAYVYRHTGTFVPISTIGADALLTGLTYAFIGDGSHQTAVPEDVRNFMLRARSERLSSQTEILSFIVKEFAKNPLPLIKLFWLKLVRSWYATAAIWWETQLLIVQLPYLLSGMIGITLSLARYPRHRLIVFFLILIAYFWLISIAAVSIIRYTMPAMIFLMPFCAFAIHTIIARNDYRSRIAPKH